MKSTPLRTVIIGVGLIVFTLVLFWTAWICDDAYFSFRPVDNLIHGYGLTWNPVERVQSFTNPLWVLLLIPFHLIYSEIYYTALFVSILLSLAAVFLILKRHAESSQAAIVVLLLILFSKPFIDFSTSGLENPLNHFLVAVFFTIYFVKEWNHRTLFHLALIASLGVVTRLDTLLLYAPALGFVWWRLRSWSALRCVALGFLPIVAWELFSLLYYGFPFPNTYYAKLSTGIDASALRLQGLRYLADAVTKHPLMMVALVAAVVAPAVVRNLRSLAAAGGIVLYSLYVINVGGDFMSGRFFTVPFVVALIILARQPMPTKGWRVLTPIVAALIVGLIPIIFGHGLGHSRPAELNPHGITDEWAQYSPDTALRNNLDVDAPNQHRWARFGRQLRTDTTRVFVAGGAGMIGYYAGPQVTVVDQDALGDPLLSRLPTVDRQDWRIGHFRRIVPLGYIQSLSNGKNELLDSNLAQYYDHLCVLTKGDVFSWSRFKEIARFNLKAYDYLVQRYVAAPRIEVPYSEIRERKLPGTPWGRYGNTVLEQNGMTVVMDSIVHCHTVELTIDDDDRYKLVFARAGQDVDSVTIDAAPRPDGGLRLCVVGVPLDLATGGYDRIRIYPVSGDGRLSVGHLRLLDPEI